MTSVHMSSDGKRYAVSCAGHATGSPEICAVISTLVSTLSMWLKGRAGDGEVHITGDVISSAQADIRWEDAGTESSEQIFFFLYTAFSALHETDPSALVEVEVTLDLSGGGGEIRKTL